MSRGPEVRLVAPTRIVHALNTARNRPCRRRVHHKEVLDENVAQTRGRVVGRVPRQDAQTPPSFTESQPDADRIAQRAYERYEARGREDGHDMEDWFVAERELQGAVSPDRYRRPPGRCESRRGGLSCVRNQMRTGHGSTSHHPPALQEKKLTAVPGSAGLLLPFCDPHLAAGEAGVPRPAHAGEVEARHTGMRTIRALGVWPRAIGAGLEQVDSFRQMR